MSEHTLPTVPETTIPRLAVYRRSLLRLAESNQSTVSSERLAELAGVNAATVRRDLSYIGAEGTRGVGYDVAHLVAETGHQLGLSQETPIVIVGAGHLGRALARYHGFGSEGFGVVALFDIAPEKVGRRFAGHEVRHLSEIGRALGGAQSAIGVIATPASAAQEAADALVAAGVDAILNFAPIALYAPEAVWVQDVDVTVELHILAYRRMSAARPTRNPRPTPSNRG